LGEILSFILGGVTISFQATIPEINLAPSAQFRNFIYSGPSEVLINIHALPLIVKNFEAPNFQSGNWILYEIDKNSIFQLHFSGSFPDYEIQTLALNRDRQSGDLYPGTNFRNSPQTGALKVPPFIFDEILTASILAARRGLIFHACGISDFDQQGLMFVGVSGAGKSTVANIWQAAGAKLLSDERVAVREQDGKYLLYGTPWHGTGQISIPDSAPLKKIFIIRHAAKNVARPLRTAEAITLLMARSYLPFWDRKDMAFSLQFLDELCQSIPVYELGFVPDASMVDYVNSISMTGKG
jgi:hypothetical protein